ncbi:hypothetical protein BDV96DRAFT_643282 [Lophiotrema nucula]|uniref:Rhodopsin domain-containing protein n=1 Tax=Lophiotrema nucula TaxID=690887 RepID=A0A6A5ZLL3_9PLEO|nr:hypothetical protein BDV96DRAFT_643282 [Lophiotrema nucula]
MAGARVRQANNVAPPAAAITPLNHEGLIVVANALGLVLALLAIVVRVYIRKRISPPSKKDDAAAWIATCLGALQAVLVFWQVNKGFGKTINDISREDIVKVQKIGYATDPLFIATVYTTKCSLIFLLLRITPNEKHQQLLRLGLGACVVLAIVSVIVILTRCKISEPWQQYNGECGDMFARWQAVAAFDVATELVIFMVPVSFLFGLQMKIKQKGKVVLAFATRLPLIALILLRLYALRTQLDSANPTLAGALAAVWTQVGLHYALIATTLPCGTPFLNRAITNFGTIDLDAMTGTQHSSARRTNEEPTRNKKAVESATLVTADDDLFEVKNKPEVRTSVRCSRPSDESSESQQAITKADRDSTDSHIELEHTTSERTEIEG